MPNLVVDPKFLAHTAGIGNDTRQMLAAFESESPYLGNNILPLSKYLTGRPRKIRDLATAISSSPIKLKVPDKSDLIYIPHISGLIPPIGVRTIWRIHDLFPLSNPEWFTPIGVRLFKNTLKRIDFNENFFLCNSQTTQDIFLKVLPVKKSNVQVIPCLPNSTNLSKCEKCEGCQQDFTSFKYILNVNTIEPRKNISYIAKIWAELGFEGAFNKVVIVGKIGWKVSERDTQVLNQGDSGILHLQDVCDGSLEQIFQNTLGYISTSYAEGFNMPAENARRLGLPLFLSDIAVHRELYSGDRTFFFDFDSSEKVANKIKDIFSTSKQPYLKMASGPRAENLLADVLKRWNLI